MRYELFIRMAADKFRKGAAEHQTPFDNDHIDANKELIDEFLDVFNYAKLLYETDPEMALQLQEAAFRYVDRLYDQNRS